jgi:hypothetical protein
VEGLRLEYQWDTGLRASERGSKWLISTVGLDAGTYLTPNRRCKGAKPLRTSLDGCLVRQCQYSYGGEDKQSANLPSSYSAD